MFGYAQVCLSRGTGLGYTTYPCPNLVVEFFQLVLLCAVVALCLSGIGSSDNYRFGSWVNRLCSKRRIILILTGAVTLLGCLIVSTLLHAPIPRIHDEFSYLLMSDTLAHRRAQIEPLPDNA
jgi:hypothetical protein